MTPNADTGLIIERHLGDEPGVCQIQGCDNKAAQVVYRQGMAFAVVCVGHAGSSAPPPEIMTEHVHDWGDASTVPPRAARMCRAGDCTEWAVAWWKKWRPPTATERLSLLARMMEDVAIGRAMQVIHGRERGIQRAREARGYDRLSS